MTTTDIPAGLETLSDKPKRWDFSRDAVTPGRLVAWGSEIAVASALVAPLADIPWEAGAAAGVLCTGTAIMYEKARGSWRRVMVARASSWMATTGWLSYALATRPTLLTMVIGGAVWGTGAAVNIGMDRWGETTREAEKTLDERLQQGEQIKAAQEGWAKLLYEICGIENAVADPVIDRWPSGAGYTVKVTLPAHLNIDSLKGYEAELAGALHLPKGGGVAFSAGGADIPRNVIFIAVTQKNLMSGAIPYPSLSPSTVNKPIGFGRIGNGTEAGLNLKDEGALAVGAQGSGKTALMKTVGLGYIRCDDGILWDMDTSAKMSAPFINPYLRHGIGVPLVDWPATTADECELMVIAARAIISARKTFYADLLEDENVDNLPARPDLPAILIRVDETKSMSDAAAEGLDWIIEEGRSVNVRVMNTGLRATRDFVTASMDELMPGRIGLRTNNASELAMLFPDHGAPDMAVFTDPGTVVYMSTTKGPFQPTPAKAYATMPDPFTEGSPEWQRMVDLFMDAARQLSPLRPLLDEVSANAAGLAYEQRWARVIPNLRAGPSGKMTADRVHESVWELYQTWPTPIPAHSLLHPEIDEEGNQVSYSGEAATIPRLSQAALSDDELDRLAAQDAAVELAKTNVAPKTPDALTIELFAAMGRSVRPSEVYPLMVKAGYDKSDRTFRDLCAKLSLQDKLIRGDDGTYAAVESGEVPHAGRIPGPKDDPDGRGDAPHH
ncbi:hypothetical protein [Streptomyces sp. NPDC047868]|uniref:hypothetical protein n=1 Tax=Streptomyces sp. NPDC047868 TaxID=3155480 RepID=UPI003452D511